MPRVKVHSFVRRQNRGPASWDLRDQGVAPSSAIVIVVHLSPKRRRGLDRPDIRPTIILSNGRHMWRQHQVPPRHAGGKMETAVQSVGQGFPGLCRLCRRSCHWPELSRSLHAACGKGGMHLANQKAVRARPGALGIIRTGLALWELSTD